MASPTTGGMSRVSACLIAIISVTGGVIAVTRPSDFIITKSSFLPVI